MRVGKDKHPPGAELEMEDKWAKVHVALGSAEEVTGQGMSAESVRELRTVFEEAYVGKRRGRPKGSRNKQMVAGETYQRTDIQTQDEENK